MNKYILVIKNALYVYQIIEMSVDMAVTELFNKMSDAVTKCVDEENVQTLMENFTTLLASDYKNILTKLVSKASVNNVVSKSDVVVAAGVGGGRAAKRVSGFNIYISERCSELKKSNPDEKNHIVTARTEWNALSDDDKKVYKERADARNAENAPAANVQSGGAAKAPRAKNAYTMFMSSLKGSIPKGEQAGKYAAELWKAMSDTDKQEWKDKASA